jgi:hypothetical protein
VGGACGTHGRWEKRAQGFDGKTRKEKDHLKDQGVDERIGIKMDLRETGWGGGVWSGFTWLRIGTVGGLL